MPRSTSPADAVLDALGFALFARQTPGTLTAVSDPPEWLNALWPTLGAAGSDINPAELSPFLDNFLIDAEECWRAGGDKRARSGPWVEQTAGGETVQVEATALTSRGQAILLLEKLGEEFEAKKAMLQKARENVIAYQRLNSEIQKKEILLHCVAEEMTGALANVITSLRLLEMEDSSPKARVLLGLASRATIEQQALIHKILDVFSDELSSLFRSDGAEADADLMLATERAMQSTAEAFIEKKVRLISPWAESTAIKVSLDEAHLEHVIRNLLENALERTQTGGDVDLSFDEKEVAVVLRVDDSGAAVSRGACDDLFSQKALTTKATTPAALRLHFCRMTLESCGGEIGCGAREGEGNRFWIRLPKAI